MLNEIKVGKTYLDEYSIKQKVLAFTEKYVIAENGSDEYCYAVYEVLKDWSELPVDKQYVYLWMGNNLLITRYMEDKNFVPIFMTDKEAEGRGWTRLDWSKTELTEDKQ